jgi:glucosamine--fructose-6-phosphate aminotransferase (isomerizing)
MCGIIGILGCKCFNPLINGLKQLQNRGYDSAGVAVLCSTNNTFVVEKFASTFNENAVDKLQLIGESFEGKTKFENAISGIAHVRWATHGPPSDINAHPHCDSHNTFCLVHNGIIENYQELKTMLIDNGMTFKSQTDSEVIVNLISFEYRQLKNKPQACDGNNQQYEPSENDLIKKAIQTTISQLRGTYALVILCVNEPDRMYCIRSGSPLIIGLTESYAIVTSEKSGFNGDQLDHIILDNHNLITLTHKYNVITYTTESNDVKVLKYSQETHHNHFSEIGVYPHWTLKEIYEQIDSSSRAMSKGGRILSEHQVRLGGLDIYAPQLSGITDLILLGCGTSYHAAIISSHYFKTLCNFSTVQVFDGAEFTQNDFPRNLAGNSIGCIFLSQSGETQDLHRCIKLAKQNGACLIGVVNVVDSLIAREVDCGVYLNAGREVGVASTKSFTSQLTVLMLIANWFSQLNLSMNYMKRVRCIKELHVLPLKIKETIDISTTICPTLVKYFDGFTSCFILGKGTGEGLAKEGALKIKEISYIHAEGYSASALKHGPFALLQPKFPVIILGLDNEYFDKCINAMEEIKARGATVIFITNKYIKGYTGIYEKSDVVIELPSNTEHIGDILSIIPLQLLAYYLSIHRKINPDFPRNLAKVVTVE